jgi:hypothetical protein
MRVDQAEAIRLFESSHPLNLLARFTRGPLLRLALIQLPYRVFNVTTRKRDQHHLAFDTFAGTLDPYSLDDATEFEESRATDRNHLPMRLTEEQTRSSAEGRYQRIRFQEGFFRHSNVSVALSDEGSDFFIPYWVGFLGRRERQHLVVLDAVRRTQEGSRLRHVLETWLSETNPR